MIGTQNRWNLVKGDPGPYFKIQAVTKAEKLKERIYAWREFVVSDEDEEKKEKADVVQTNEEIDAASGVPLSKAEELQSTIFVLEKDIIEIESNDLMTSYSKYKEFYQEQLKIPILQKKDRQLFRELYRVTRDTLIKQSIAMGIKTDLILNQLDIRLLGDPNTEVFGNFLTLKPDEMWSKAALCDEKWIDFVRIANRFVSIGVSERICC